jgi:hypothetical protein
MCAKLKCCLNYEVDDYMEAGRRLPSREVQLETQDNTYYYFKVDILAGLITYSTDRRMAANLETITGERAREVVEMNRRGEKPLSLQPDGQATEPQGPVDLLAGGDVARFDKAKKKKRKPAKRKGEQAKDEQAKGDAPAE